MLLAILRHYFLDSFLQGFVVVFGGQRQHISSMTKELVADTPVNFKTLWYRHAKTSEHDGDQSTSTCAVHVVEIVAWQKLVLVECLPRAASNRALFSL